MKSFLFAKYCCGRFATLALLALTPTCFADATLGSDSSRFRVEAFSLVNKERQQIGLPALADSRNLAKVAQWMADDLASRDTFGHVDSSQRDFEYRTRQFGLGKYRFLCENLAIGHRNPAEVVDAWMRSIDHRENILATEPTEVSVALSFHPKRKQWVWVMVAGAE